MSRETLNAILCLGILHEKVRKILEETQEIDCSKHNSDWHSEHEREAELLDQARAQVSYLRDKFEELLLVFDQMKNFE